jgi:hypothetical protein
METLADFLKGRAKRSFRKLLEQVEGVTPEEALRDLRPNWPDQRWGIGQNGSIAGLVYHVAAWKQMTLPLFRSGSRALMREEFDPNTVPATDDWPGLVAWLKRAGLNWNRAVNRLPEAAFDETRAWDGMTLTLGKIIVEMIEHDVQHTAQIAYLRQRHLAEGDSA